MIILDALAAIPVGLVIAGVALLVGIPVIAVWAGWSRNRYCEQKGWRNLGRW